MDRATRLMALIRNNASSDSNEHKRVYICYPDGTQMTYRDKRKPYGKDIQRPAMCRGAGQSKVKHGKAQRTSGRDKAILGLAQ